MVRKQFSVSVQEVMRELNIPEITSNRLGVISLPLVDGLFVSGKCESLLPPVPEPEKGDEDKKREHEAFNRVFYLKNLSICTIGLNEEEGKMIP